MNRFLKTLFSLGFVLAFGITALSYQTYALIDAPEPPVEGLTTVRGVVRSSVPIEVTLSDGTTYLSANHPLQGVSIFIYECANDSVSCKKNGFLTFPFASTTTNVNGEFYIYMRKLDSVDKGDFVFNGFGFDKRNESKRRYLVMYCNDKFAGMEILPSWGEWEELDLEADCPEFSSNVLYKEPLFTLAFFNPTEKLAPHMGLPDDEELPLEIQQEAEATTDGSTPVKIPQYAIQAINSIDPKNVEIPFYLDIEAFDRRFLPKYEDPIYDMAFNLGHMEPGSGAYWDLDCRIRYSGNEDLEKYCLSYGLDSTPEQAIKSLQLVESGGNIYAEDPDNPGTALTTDPWKPLFTSGEFRDFWENGKVSRENQTKIKTQLLYYHPYWVVKDFLTGIPYIKKILAYRDVVAKDDVPQVGQNELDFTRHSQTHYSNCVGETYIRYYDETSTDTYPLCEIYKECSAAVTISSGSGVDAYRNSHTTMGAASQLMSPADQEYIYTFADLNTPICVMEPGGEAITLGQIQPPWDYGNGSGYALDKSYWSNEFLTHRGDLNDLAVKEPFVFENSNDSYDNSAVNDDFIQVFSEADIMQGGTMAVHQNGGYASNASGKAVYNYTGGYLPLTDYYSSPVEDALYDRKLASQTGVMSYAGTAKLMSEVSNVNVSTEAISQTPSDDKSNFLARNELFGGPVHHYPPLDDSQAADLSAISDIYYSQYETLGDSPEFAEAKAYTQYLNYSMDENGQLYSYDPLKGVSIPQGSLEDWQKEHRGEILNFRYGLSQLNTSLDLGEDGSRSNTEDDKKTSASWRRDVALSNVTGGEGDLKGIRKFAINYPGHDFLDSALQMTSGDGNLTSLSINPEDIELLYQTYAAAAIKDDDKSVIEKIGSFISDIFNKRKDQEGKGQSVNKATFDRYNADETKGVNPALLDHLTVSFELNEENFKDIFILPSRTTRDTDGNVIGSDPYWLDPEDWGYHDCYPWGTVGLRGKCDTAKEDYNSQGETYQVGINGDGKDGVSRTCRVDQCLVTTTKIQWDCEWNGTQGALVKGSPHVSSIDVTSEPCDRNIDVSEDRKICAYKQVSCLEADPEGGGARVVPGGMGRESGDIDSTRNCLRWVAYKGQIENALKDVMKDPKCPQSMSAYFENGILVTKSKDTTLNTPSCLVSVAGPFACYGNLEEDSTLEIDGQIARDNEAVIDLADSYVADLKLSTLFRPPAYDELNDGTSTTDNLTSSSTKEYLDNSFAGKPASFVTGDSTLSREDRIIDDTAKAVDVLAPGFGGSSLIASQTRARFAAPNKIVANAPLNSVNYHCKNDYLPGTGELGWDCPVWPEPDPVEIDTAQLKVDSSCGISATPKCLEAVFGKAYTGTTNACEENNGICYDGIFECPAGKVRDDNFSGSCSDNKYCCITKEEDVRMDYTSYVEPEFSDTFLQIIGAAATEYKIPASAILAYMASEGSLSQYAEYFSTTFEDELYTASAPWYGGFRGCDDVATNAQGPYNWILKWFNFVWDKNAERDTLNSLSKYRGNTASRCNFLDSTYATAMTLAVNAGKVRTDCSGWTWEMVAGAIGGNTYGSDAQGAYAERIGALDFGGYNVFKECNPNPVD